MTKASIPDGFMTISVAVARLEQGMWGGLRRPTAVRDIKATLQKASIGFGPWREEAAQCFRIAATKGELTVYIVLDPVGDCSRCIVPINVLKNLVSSRGGGLPDHPIRPSLKKCGGDEKLLALLVQGRLAVREQDFLLWYQTQRAKTQWPSQQSSSKKRKGRPAKDSETLQNAILSLVRDGEWSGKDSVMKLHRLLSGRFEIPSHDTLGRLVRRLHIETGEPQLRKVQRVRRKRT